MAREVRCWVTDRQTHMTTTVTLAAQAHRGLKDPIAMHPAAMY